MKLNKMKFTALTMAALMAVSAMPFSAYAADDAEILIEDDYEVYDEVGDEVYEEDVYVDAEEDLVGEESEAFEVDPESIYFYYKETDKPDFSVDYEVVGVQTGERQAREATATTYETTEAKCGTPATLTMQVVIDGSIYYSKPFQTAPGLEHKWKEVDRYIDEHPTCTEPGKGHVNMICELCGDKMTVSIDDELQPLGHDWGEWQTRLEADENTKIVDNEAVLEDVSKDGTYYVIEYRVCKRDASHVEEKNPEKKVILAKQQSYARVVKQTGIETNLIGLYYPEEVPANEKIELKKCTEDGSYTVGYFAADGTGIAEEVITVEAHHMTTAPVVEFDSEDDMKQCVVTYKPDGTYTITNKSCYLTIHYHEVIHCTAKGCPNEKCEDKLIVPNDEYTGGGTVVSTVKKDAEPEGPHIINTVRKTEITALAANDAYVDYDYLKTLEKNKDSYIKVSENTATCEEDGTATVTYLCKICNHEIETQTVKTEKLGHKAKAPVRENVVPATCASAGSYDAVVYCERCGKELSRRDGVVIPRLKHTNETSVGVDDTETDTNAQVEFVGTVVVDANGAIKVGDVNTAFGISAGNNGAEEDYIVTAQAFTLCETCGEHKVVIDGEPSIKVDSIEKSQYSCQPGSITLTATYTRADDTKATVTDSFKYYTSINQYQGRTPHDPADPVIENEVAATATENGSYDEVIYCKICGEEISRKTVTVNATGDVILPAVTGLKAVTTGMNRVKLTWDAVEGADGYVVIGLNEFRSGSQIGYTTSTSWTDIGADADAWNFYWVVAFKKNNSGKNVLGELGSYVYALGRVVGKVTKVTAVAGSKSVSLSWAGVRGANSYVILSRTGSDSPVAIGSTEDTSFVDKNAQSGVPTFYWVYGVYNNSDNKTLVAGKTSPYAWAAAK